MVRDKYPRSQVRTLRGAKHEAGKKLGSLPSEGDGNQNGGGRRR